MGRKLPPILPQCEETRSRSGFSTRRHGRIATVGGCCLREGVPDEQVQGLTPQKVAIGLGRGISRALIRPVATPLVWFTGDVVSPLGVSNLMMRMGMHPQQVMKMVEFTIMDMADGAYNGIIDRPVLSQFEAVVSPIHTSSSSSQHDTGPVRFKEAKSRHGDAT
ncbi:hypothetical protein LIER_19810 [Lithospermum erythrorhizon]|uniref:Uncharacterized protein n=1 Tax=Lithospermum erythrorhizon TaxID=34254 RepID=A0AAV3QK77_LITER